MQKDGRFSKTHEAKNDHTSAAVNTSEKTGLKKWIQEEMKSQLKKRFKNLSKSCSH